MTPKKVRGKATKIRCPKRPPSAYILFKQFTMKALMKEEKSAMAIASSMRWAALSDDDKKVWEDEARSKKSMWLETRYSKYQDALEADKKKQLEKLQKQARELKQVLNVSIP